MNVLVFNLRCTQFFEFNFEVAGYQDITGREFSANADDGVVGEITNTSLHIQIVGTDNNADGRLEPQKLLYGKMILGLYSIL